MLVENLAKIIGVMSFCSRLGGWHNHNVHSLCRRKNQTGPKFVDINLAAGQ